MRRSQSLRFFQVVQRPRSLEVIQVIISASFYDFTLVMHVLFLAAHISARIIRALRIFARYQNVIMESAHMTHLCLYLES